MSFIGKKAAFPPLGLLTVAALFPEEWSRRLVDVNVADLTDNDLSWADMAFIGAMAVQQESAKQIIARCRAKGLKVIAGGPLFTAEPDEFEEVDHLVLDEAELTLPSFIEDLQNGHLKRVYRASSFCDLHHTPIPSWDLIPMKRYASMSIQFSRGCPFNCEFCNVTALFGHRPRLKTSQQVIAELDRVYDAGWRGSIFFVDDNFIGNKRYLKTQLLPALIDWRKDKRGCVFFTEASIDLADDPELLDLMVKAGFDSDTHSTFQRQIDFIQQSGIVTAMVGILQAPPGTRLFARLQRENRVVSAFSGDNVIASSIPPGLLRLSSANHQEQQDHLMGAGCSGRAGLVTGNPLRRRWICRDALRSEASEVCAPAVPEIDSGIDHHIPGPELCSAVFQELEPSHEMAQGDFRFLSRCRGRLRRRTP